MPAMEMQITIPSVTFASGKVAGKKIPGAPVETYINVLFYVVHLNTNTRFSTYKNIKSCRFNPGELCATLSFTIAAIYGSQRNWVGLMLKQSLINLYVTRLNDSSGVGKMNFSCQ